MATNRLSMAELRRRVERENGVAPDDSIKTAAMYRLERKFKHDIRWLLDISRGTGKQLAHKYGVTESAISLWRKKLGIKIKNSSHYAKGHYPERWL